MRAVRLILVWCVMAGCWSGNALAASISVIQTSSGPGRSIGASVRFVADSGKPVTAIQFDIAFDKSDLSVVVVADATLVASGKFLSTEVLPDGTLRCLITGINNNEIPDARLVNLVITLTPTARRVPYSLILLNAAAAVAMGGPVALDARSGTLIQATGFTDELLMQGVSVIRAVHFTDLRSRIDALRARYGLTAYSYTTGVIHPGVSEAVVADILEMRRALSDVYDAASWSPPMYETQPVRGDLIRVTDLVELRLAVFAIE